MEQLLLVVVFGLVSGVVVGGLLLLAAVAGSSLALSLAVAGARASDRITWVGAAAVALAAAISVAVAIHAPYLLVSVPLAFAGSLAAIRVVEADVITHPVVARVSPSHRLRGR